MHRHQYRDRTVVRPLLLLLLAAVLATGCSRSGPVRRVSEPAASIQQLSVGVDGNWLVELRLQNFSSIPMQFAAIALTIQINDTEAGELHANPALIIGPESADIISIPVQPAADARLLLADALAAQRGIGYRLHGSVDAHPHDRDKPRSYDIRHHSALNPVPGLPGVLR